MADESEKRFHTIMDKLFHTPKPKPKPSSASSDEMPPSGGKKRLKSGPASKSESSSIGSLVEDNGFRRSMIPVGSQAPLCRPWDRGDLMRRLSTFKSMTWFGKPKVVSPVNCARKGWVNVEMDIISCEACGSRLLFSTPSSWMQQQVEKAAAVFSLKLDSGHRLLCPWINNACDEALVLFPPTPAPALVTGYNKRSSALLQLLSLPVISSAAIEYMRSPQLERLLAQSSHPVCTLGDGTRLTGFSGDNLLDNESEAVSAYLYYQAQKVISLCGWEPRLLCYVVDCEDRSVQSAKDAHPAHSSSLIISGQYSCIAGYSSSALDEVSEETQNISSHGEYQFNPSSVVLDCRLCGASVGLWAFPTVPRPLELFRLIQSPEDKDQSESANIGANVSNQIMADPTSSSNLTIAGGLPPTKQNPRATVSLPIISRYLRTGLYCSSDVRNSDPSIMIGQENIQCVTQDGNKLLHEKDHRDGTLTGQEAKLDDIGTLKRKRSADKVCIFEGRNFDGPASPNEEQRSGDMSSEGGHSNENGLLSADTPGTSSDCTREMPMENMQNRLQDLGTSASLSADAEHPEATSTEHEAGVASQTCEWPDTTTDANGTVGKGEINQESSLKSSEDVLGTDLLNCRLTSQGNHEDSSCVESSLGQNKAIDNASNGDFGKGGDKGPDYQNSADMQLISQTVAGVTGIVQSSLSNDVVAAHGSGRDIIPMRWDKTMEFDPIRQHRHFCPWIASPDPTKMPGWKLTLSALDNEKASSALHTESSSTLSMSEDDDPIISVRKLFMTPSEKKRKVIRRLS